DFSTLMQGTSGGGRSRDAIVAPDTAYGLFVMSIAGGPGSLATGRFRAPAAGYLRDLVDFQLDKFDDLLSLAEVAAALTAVNDRQRSRAAINELAKRLDVVAQASPRQPDAPDMNSLLSTDELSTAVRDLAGTLALAAASGASTQVLTKIAVAFE